MGFFGYYALHSFINQLRKLMKTWVLIFFAVCLVLGIVIGIGAARLEDSIEEHSEAAAETVVQAEENGPPEWMTISSERLIELAAGGLLLALFAFEAVSADKNGGKIFLPADVNLLFPSPMHPQSVLMFRLGAQLGTALLASIYMVFQLPNLILYLGLSGWAAGGLLVTWFFAIFIGKLVQVLLYILCSTHTGLKKYLSPAVYALLLAAAGGFAFSSRLGGPELLQSADRFFNAPITRWIPLWGWLKGFIGYMAAEDLKMAGMFLLLTAAGALGLLLVIYRTKADFYEDAMAKSEETAALMEKARSEKMSGVGAVRQRNKDRSDKLLRDGLNHGNGASVFLWKTLYNRRRFSLLGFITKTMAAYLAAALGMAAVGRYLLNSSEAFLIALPLGGLVFFRAMGDPLEEDTAMDFFRLIPESAVSKLLYSLLGGTAGCLLDLLPAMIIGALCIGCSPLRVLAWLPLILSVDFYASSTVSFIDLSVPTSTGRTIKTLITVMFVYFGLLPDIGILAFGITAGHTLSAALGAAAVNLALGFVFLCLASVWLEPGGKDFIASATDVDLMTARRHFSKTAFAMALLMAATYGSQLAAIYLLQRYAPAILACETTMWLLSFVPQYLIGLPLAWLILHKIPAVLPEKNALGIGRGIKIGFITIFLMYAGNLTGILVIFLIGSLLNISIANPLESYVSGSSILLQILFMVILAPVFEEVVFRKMIIDRLRVYGGRSAVVVSALIFGLMHGNLSQFFYAFALGLVFGYLYLRTGRLRYTIAGHTIVNFIGSVVSVTLLERASETGVLSGWSIAFYCYAALLLISCVAGFVLLFMNYRKLQWSAGPQELPKESRLHTVWLNPGMICMLLLGAASMVHTILSNR